MILPIYGYGFPVLRKKASEIEASYPNLAELIENMWETMYNASGVGLAAPQVGLSIRLFLVDTAQTKEENDENKGIKKAFINAEILEESGKEWKYEEGCLSIPKVTADVQRPPSILIRYQDENFVTHEERYEGMEARVIQHEYDHIEGVLFVDLVKPLKKRFLKKKLDNIKIGNAQADYRMKYWGRK